MGLARSLGPGAISGRKGGLPCSSVKGKSSSRCPTHTGFRGGVTLHILCVKSPDGKRRRPKADQSSSSPPPPPNDPPQAGPPSPPRISNTINIPVRRQIRYVQQARQASSEVVARRPLTKPYRRESKSPEEHRQQREAEAAIAAELSKKESKNIALASLYRSYDSLRGAANPRKPPVLLVDGYNVLHAWERTIPYMANSDLEQAREILIEELGIYSSTNGVRVVIAFDAMHGRLGATTAEYLTAMGVTVVFCGECEADSFIEDQVSVYLEKKHPRVIVATSDQAHKAVVDSKGTVDGRQLCWVVPASGLVKDIEATHRRLNDTIANLNNRPVMGGLLGSVVKTKNEEAFAAMQAMRLRMPLSPSKIRIEDTDGSQ